MSDIDWQINPYEDIIDSRDVIERLSELISEVMDEEMTSYLPDADPVLVAEFEALRELHNEAKDYSEDWKYRATLIRESYFTDYIGELCDDVNNESLTQLPDYIRNNIDWDGVAECLREDYTEVDFNGITYLVR